jgi:hypothetical protein
MVLLWMMGVVVGEGREARGRMCNSCGANCRDLPVKPNRLASKVNAGRCAFALVHCVSIKFSQLLY